jgi:hypothetical protein
MSTSLKGYYQSLTYIGGQAITPVTGTEFDESQLGFQAIYVGTIGDLVVKTFDGSVLTFASASGLLPIAISAVSSSSTATNIIGLDPVNQIFPVPTTTTLAPTTTVAPTTTEEPATTTTEEPATTTTQEP